MHPDIPAGSLLLDEEHFPDHAFRRFLIRYFLEEIVEISGEDSRFRHCLSFIAQIIN